MMKSEGWATSNFGRECWCPNPDLTLSLSLSVCLTFGALALALALALTSGPARIEKSVMPPNIQTVLTTRPSADLGAICHHG